MDLQWRTCSVEFIYKPWDFPAFNFNSTLHSSRGFYTITNDQQRRVNALQHSLINETAVVTKNVTNHWLICQATDSSCSTCPRGWWHDGANSGKTRCRWTISVQTMTHAWTGCDLGACRRRDATLICNGYDFLWCNSKQNWVKLTEFSVEPINPKAPVRVLLVSITPAQNRFLAMRHLAMALCWKCTCMAH